MKSDVSNAGSKRNWSRFVATVGACLFIALASVGLLGLCSCASTREGLSREQQLYLSASNSLVSAHAITPYLPAPASSVWEGFLAVAGAGLALWASHLHRSVSELKKNGNGNGTANGTAAASPPPVPRPPA